MEAKIDEVKADYDGAGRPARRPRRPARRRRGAGGRQAGASCAERKALLAERVRERLRHRPDLAARDVPVGRDLHRPARRDELLHRRRRAGQGARQPDRQGPGDARGAPPDGRGHARPGPTSCARRRPPRSARSTRASSALKAAKAALKKLEKRTAAALAAQKRDVRSAGQRNKASGRRRSSPRPPPTQKRAGQRKIDALIAQAGPAAATSRREYNGTLRWPMDGCTVTPELRLHRRSRGTPPRRRLRPLPQRHRHRRPRTARRSGPSRRRDRRLRRLELRRRRRPGLDRDHRPLARTCRPGTPTCSPATRAGSRRAARSSQGQVIGYEGNTGHSTGAHLHWMVELQRQLREPAPVPVAPPSPRCRRSPSGNRHVDAVAARLRASIGLVKRTMAVILAGGEGERLSILSQERAKPAVPFGGKYRIIDFTLSNCVNSDIDDVVVLTQYNPRSLNDHIGLGPAVGPRPQPRRRQAAPAVHRPRPGRRVVSRHGRRGPAQHQRHRARPGRHRPRPRRRPHLQDGLPAVRGRPSPPPGRRDDRRPARAAGRGVADGDPRPRRERPRHRVAGEAQAAQERPRLDGRLRLLEEGAPALAVARTASTSARNVIPAMLEAGARVFGYRYNGYWQDVGTIQSYWEANMAPPRRRPGARPVRQGLGHPHPVRGTRARPRSARRPRSTGASSATAASSTGRSSTRSCRRACGSTSAPSCATRSSCSTRSSAPARSSTGRSSTRRSSSARARSSATGPYDDRPNKQEPGRLNTGITVVGKRAVIPRGARIGRNVKVAADVRTSDFTGRGRRSGESVERKRAPRASRVDADQHRPAAVEPSPASRQQRPPARGRRGELTARGRPATSARLRGPCHPPTPAPRSVRPADVERWLADLGLEPARASRPRRDHQLGSRPRRTPPLRPPRHGHPRSGARRSSAGRTTRRRSTTCSASRTASCCAGTTSSRSPSSRSAEDERPLLAVELPDRGRRRRRAGPGPRPDPRHRRPAPRRVEGLAVARRPDARPGRPDVGATRRSSTATRPRLPGARWTPIEPPIDRGPRIRRRHRPASWLALVAWPSAVSLAVARRRRPEVRAATPDLTIVSERPLRRPARRSTASGSRVDLSLTNHLQGHAPPSATTSTTRSWPSCPARPGFKLTLGRGRDARASAVIEEDRRLHAPPARPRRSGCTAASRATYQLDVRPRRPGRRGRPATSASATRSCRSRSGRSPPTRRPAARSRSSSRPASRSRSRRATSRRRRPTPTGTIIFQTGKLDKPLDVLRLPRRRPARAPTPSGRSTATVGGTPVDADRPGLADDAAWAERVGGLVARGAARSSPSRSACPGRATSGLVVQEAVSRSTGGYAGLFDPSRGPVEVAYYADDFVVLHEAAHAWFNGGAPGRSLGERGVRLVLRRSRPPRRSRSRRRPTTLTPELEAARDPAQRLGPRRSRGRRRPRTTPTRRRSRSPGRSPSGPAPTACARSGPTPRRGSARTSRRPASGGRGVGGEADARAGRRTARLARPARPARGARPAPTYDDLWRTWVARDERPAAARRAARGARRATTRSSPRPATGSCRAPIRDAMRAWQFDEATDAARPTPTAVLDAARRRSTPPPTAAGLTAAGHAADRVRGRRRLRDATAEADGRARGDRPLRRRPSRRGRARPTRSRPSACGATTPEADLDRRARRVRRRRPGAVRRAPPTTAAGASGPAAEDVGPRPAASASCAPGALLALRCVAMASRRLRRRHRRLRAGDVATPAAARAATRRPAGRPVRYTRRHSGPGRPAAVGDDGRERSGSGLMGLHAHAAVARDPVRRLGRRLLRARREHPRAEGLDPLVTMEVFTRQDAVLCGIDEARNLLGHVLAGADPAETRLEALADGDVIAPKEIVLRIRARYRQFGLYETAFLGMLAQSTGWATAARECVEVAAPGAGHQLRGAAHPPGHHRRARLRGDRRRLRRRVDAGRRAARRPRPDRHDAPLAGPDLRRHRRGGPGVRPAHRRRTCRGSSSSTRSRTRPRRRCGSPTRSATGCTASGSTRRRSAAG